MLQFITNFSCPYIYHPRAYKQFYPPYRWSRIRDRVKDPINLHIWWFWKFCFFLRRKMDTTKKLNLTFSNLSKDGYLSTSLSLSTMWELLVSLSPSLFYFYLSLSRVTWKLKPWFDFGKFNEIKEGEWGRSVPGFFSHNINSKENVV